jgi:hypothetical protein
MAAQGLAGHEQVSTTPRQMHLSPVAKNEAISLLDRGEDLKAEGEQDANAASFTPEPGSGREQARSRRGLGRGPEEESPVVPEGSTGLDESGRQDLNG